MKLQLPFLASAALVLLSAVPSFAEKPSTAAAKPIESFNVVVDALIDEPADLFGEEEFDTEEEQVSKGKGKSKPRSSRRKNRRSSRRRNRRSSRRRSSRSSRRKSRRSSPRRSSSSSRSRSSSSSRSRSSRRRNRFSNDMCRGRIRNSRDRRTCDRIEDLYCSSSSTRRRNSRLCRRVGFPTVAEGVKEDAPETYAADAEVFSEDTLYDIDLIIGDIEDELMTQALRKE